MPLWRPLATPSLTLHRLLGGFFYMCLFGGSFVVMYYTNASPPPGGVCFIDKENKGFQQISRPITIPIPTPTRFKAISGHILQCRPVNMLSALELSSTTAITASARHRIHKAVSDQATVTNTPSTAYTMTWA